jgi:hypothetical protein
MAAGDRHHWQCMSSGSCIVTDGFSQRSFFDRMSSARIRAECLHVTTLHDNESGAGMGRRLAGACAPSHERATQPYYISAAARDHRTQARLEATARDCGIAITDPRVHHHKHASWQAPQANPRKHQWLTEGPESRFRRPRNAVRPPGGPRGLPPPLFPAC